MSRQGITKMIKQPLFNGCDGLLPFSDKMQPLMSDKKPLDVKPFTQVVFFFMMSVKR